MTKAPERILAWVNVDKPGQISHLGPLPLWKPENDPGDTPDDATLYTRADTARQEAAARVAALAREVLYLRFYGNKMCIHDAEKAMAAGESDDWILREIDTTARAAYEAALEQARREGAEAERIKWSASVALIERCYFIEGKDAKWRAAHMSGIARDAQNSNGKAPSWAVRLFPRVVPATVENAMSHTLPINIPLADEMQRDAERRQAMKDLRDKKEQPDTSGDEQHADDELRGEMDHG